MNHCALCNASVEEENASTLPAAVWRSVANKSMNRLTYTVDKNYRLSAVRRGEIRETEWVLCPNCFTATRPYWPTPLFKQLLKSACVILSLLVLVRAGWVVPRWLAQPGAISVAEQVKTGQVITPDLFDQMGKSIGRDFELSRQGTILLQIDDRLVEFTPGSGNDVQAALLGSAQGLQSFTADPRGAVLGIVENRLEQLVDGQFSGAVPPLEKFRGARLAPSSNRGVVYLYGGAKEEQGLANRILLIRDGGRVRNLLESPGRVTAFAEYAPENFYFATSREIFHIQGADFRLVMRVPENIEIVSLAVAADGKTLYFSSKNRVYGLKGLTAVSIALNVGGTLRFHKGVLYVLDPQRRVLLRFRNLDAI